MTTKVKSGVVGDIISGQTEDTSPDVGADYVLTYDASGAAAKKVLAGRLGGVLRTPTTTTSGTSHDYTDIPSWVTKITILIAGLSLSGTANPLIQIGDSGGIETTGYLGAGSTMPNASATGAANSTAGFIFSVASAARVLHGFVTLYLLDSSTNTWVAGGVIGYSDFAATGTLGGSKSLSGTLDRIRLTTTNGTDTFDAGSINVRWE